MSCERLCLHTAHLHAPQVTHINNNQKQHQRASPKWVDSVSFRFEIGVGIEFLGAPNRLVGKWPQGLACPWLGKHRCVRGCPRKQVCMLFSRVGWDYPGARSLSWTPQEGLVFLSPCLPTYFHAWLLCESWPPKCGASWQCFIWNICFQSVALKADLTSLLILSFLGGVYSVFFVGVFSVSSQYCRCSCGFWACREWQFPLASFQSTPCAGPYNDR